MSDLVTFAGANLPTVASLSASLRKLESTAGPAGIAILKMDRTGHWVFGADQTEVEDGSHWAVNPFSFVHGYIAWGDGVVLGERLASVSDPLPELDVAPPGAKKGWEMQVGMSVKCLTGEDEGMEARFTATSLGGKRAVQELAVTIAAQVDKDQTTPVPIVTLGKAHYPHKLYGRIYTPVFDVLKWISLTAEAAAPEAAVEAAVEAPAKNRRRVVA
jgi:hypothetical protein